MELKTKVHAEEGKQDLTITREFDLPVKLLFKAFAEPELIAQWREVEGIKFEGKKHGSYAAEKRDAKGNVIFKVHGVFHEFMPNQKIIRTFEVENAPFGASLEFYEFKKLTDSTSKLNLHILYQSADIRDQILKMPNDQAMEMAFTKLEEVMNKLK